MHHGRFARVWMAVITPVAGCAVAGAVPSARRAEVRPGIDVVLSDSVSLLRGRRVGFVTNVAAVDAHGVSAITRLRAAGIQLVALFAPEHGLTVTAAPGQQVGSTVDSASRIPIYSLYGRTIAPTAAMLAGIDVMVIDLPDVGARYYTYLATTVEVMKAAAAHQVPVVILDRPNPIGGAMQGNILDTAYTSMVGRLAVPMRHGLTLGEEARLARVDLGIPVQLTVIPAAGWRRDMLFDETGLPFRAPSPNLQDVEALFDYPGTCLFEGTSLSVGRGTDAPFRQVGAPWLDTTAVLARLRALHLAGVAFSGVTFVPHGPGDGKFADTLVAGLRWRVADHRGFDPPAAAVALLAVIESLYPDRIGFLPSFDRLAGGPALRVALQHGEAAGEIVASWQAGLEAYRRRVQPVLLYR